MARSVAKWAQSVAPWKNWRVIEVGAHLLRVDALTKYQNEIAEPIYELIGKLRGWEHIPTLFKQIYESRTAVGRPWKGRFSLKVGNESLHWNLQDHSLRPLSTCEGDSEKAVLQALDATKISKSSATMTQVLSIHPHSVRCEGLLTTRSSKQTGLSSFKERRTIAAFPPLI